MPKEETDEEDGLKKRKTKKMVVLDSDGSEIDEMAAAEKMLQEKLAEEAQKKAEHAEKQQQSRINQMEQNALLLEIEQMIGGPIEQSPKKKKKGKKDKE